MTELILSCIAICIFVIYNAVAIHFFGIPRTLSETYYLYEGKKKNLGYVFTGMMFSVALLLMPAWIQITENISSWSHYLTVLPFLGAASIAFVGSAPAFRNVGVENRVHMIAAGCAAAFSLSWCAVVCWKVAYIIPISFVIVWITAWLTKTYKTCSGYWWEMVAFLATFVTILTECCILL